MAHVVFIPYPETGHINATFKVAKGLRARGHRIDYMALVDYEGHLRAQGLGFLPILKELCPEGFIRRQAIEGRVQNFEAILRRAAEGGRPLDPAQEALRVLEGVRPDVFVVDLLLPGLALAIARSGGRVVLMNTQLFNPWDELKAIYDPLRGLPELILCPQEFDFPGTERRAACHYVEASIDLERRDASFPWDRVDGRKPLVYCSLGSQSHLMGDSGTFFRALLEAAAADTRRQFVLSVGADLKVEDFPAPPNVLVVNTAPQLEILKRASVMLSHGGFNSIKEGIFFGVPMILFPMIRDHPAIAARVLYHGLGLRGKFRPASAGQFRALLDEVEHNPSFKERVEAMGRRFREVERSSPGIHIIEAVVKSEFGGRAAGGPARTPPRGAQGIVYEA
jgi:UDP:flavonoid glycosyltransferase YjiC (YdhE family)